MFLKIFEEDKQYSFYNTNEVNYKNLNIVIKESIFINGVEYKLRKRIIKIDSYDIFINPQKKKFYSNYKYQKLKHIEISSYNNSSIINKFLESNVIINENILSTNSKYVFINNIKSNYKVLEENDVIEIFDLRIIYKHKFYMINNKKLKLLKFEIYEYHNYLNHDLKNARIYYRKEIKKPIVNHQLMKLNISTINESNNIFFTILPSIVMSLSSLTVGLLSAYNAYISNRSINEIMIFLILPIAMIISSVIIMPLQQKILKSKQKKKIEEEYVSYEKYLSEVYQGILNEKESYVNFLKSRYLEFDTLVVTNDLFNKQTYHSDYLNLAIGKGNVKTNFEIEHSIENLRILKKIKDYNNQIMYIDNCFIELSILDYNYISIINYNNYFNYILLQLISYYKNGCFNLVVLLNEEQLNNNLYLKYINQFIFRGVRLIAKNVQNVNEVNKLLKNSENDNIIIVYDQSLMSYVCINAHYILVCDSNNIYPKSDFLIDSKKCKYYYNKEEYSFEFTSGNIEKRVIELSNYNFPTNDTKHKKNNLYELFQIENINELTINEYKNSLDTVIGVNLNNELVHIDIHEKADGAHGIVVGTTGSGKSEFIISLLLSLAMTYSPRVLNMVIIDFKGTTIISNLKYKNCKLPHVINNLSNIDEKNVQRALMSFKIECKKRMVLFKKMSERTNESSMNIDLYQKVYKKEYNLDFLAHLLIVIDEFAEFKSNNDYFMKEIISLARIGRSLGIHLLLSTQKVSGVVNDEILANISYRICLKLNDISESKIMIGNNNAYYLKDPGEFYLYHNQELQYGKGVMASVTSDLRSLSEKVIILDNMMHEVTKRNLRKSNSLKQNEEIVMYLNKLYRNTRTSLWLENLSNISLDRLKSKYNVDNELIVGEYDDITTSKQGLLNFDINSNAVMFSLNNELKIAFIVNLIYGFNNSNNKMIIIDFSYINFLEYKNCKNIIDISEDIEHIYDIFNYLENRKTNNKLLVVVNNVSKIYRDHIDLQNRLFNLLNESYKNNIVFLLVGNNYQSVNYKHLNIIKNIYTLDVKNKTELLNIFDGLPLNYEEGIYYDGNYYNFRIPKGNKNDLIYEKSIEQIARIPKIIKFEFVNNMILIGYNLNSYKKVYHNLNNKLLITSFDLEILDFYKELYNEIDNITVIQFSKINNNNCNFNYILFLKPGIRKQFIFDNELEVNNEDEGIYIKNHKSERIKYVNERLCKL